MYELIKEVGDVTDSKHMIILQQNNLENMYNGGGVASQIYNQFRRMKSYAKCYKEIDAYGNYQNWIGKCTINRVGPERFVVNLYGQICPGRPYMRRNKNVHDQMKFDTKEHREVYFQQALLDMEKNMLTFKNFADLVRKYGITVPCGIGCGIGGGDWNKYRTMLTDFAERLEIKLTIVSRS
jgi:O-acetyl-ADP-ribose deacetylase (regulator of RNase III)